MNNKGFSLLELSIVIAIISVVLTGMLQLFIYTSVQAEMAGNKSMAITNVSNKIEEIRNTTYDNVYSTYNGTTFGLAGVNGQGRIDIDNSNTELLVITITASWLDKYDRVVGEDLNLNGVFDAGTEDLNGNNIYDSPARIISMFTRR